MFLIETIAVGGLNIALFLVRDDYFGLGKMGLMYLLFSLTVLALAASLFRRLIGNLARSINVILLGLIPTMMLNLILCFTKATEWWPLVIGQIVFVSLWSVISFLTL